MKNPSKPKYRIGDIVVLKGNELVFQGIIKKAWVDISDNCWRYEVSENRFALTYQEDEVWYKLS